MAIQEQQLAQARENSTNAVSIYSPSSNETAIIKSIILCNVTSSLSKVRIFIDNDGSVFDESTAIFYDINVHGNETIELDSYIPMNNENGNLAYRVDVANSVTITVSGAVI